MGEYSNQPPDSFEAELATFRPRPMSPDLPSRIESRLTESRPYWHVGVALLAFAAAACVIVGIAVPWSRDPKPGTNSVSIGTRPSPTIRGGTFRAASSPSVMDYQRAFAESSDAFDALLARPAGRGSASEHRSSPADVMSAFSRSISSPSNSTSNGDLP